jgi:hypothetical protein
MLKFRRMKTLQKFSSVQAAVHNPFNPKRHLASRDIFKPRRSAALAGGARSWPKGRSDVALRQVARDGLGLD